MTHFISNLFFYLLVKLHIQVLPLKRIGKTINSWFNRFEFTQSVHCCCAGCIRVLIHTHIVRHFRLEIAVELGSSNWCVTALQLRWWHVWELGYSGPRNNFNMELEPCFYQRCTKTWDFPWLQMCQGKPPFLEGFSYNKWQLACFIWPTTNKYKHYKWIIEISGFPWSGD